MKGNPLNFQAIPEWKAEAKCKENFDRKESDALLAKDDKNNHRIVFRQDERLWDFSEIISQENSVSKDLKDFIAKDKNVFCYFKRETEKSALWIFQSDVFSSYEFSDQATIILTYDKIKKVFRCLSATLLPKKNLELMECDDKIFQWSNVDDSEFSLKLIEQDEAKTIYSENFQRKVSIAKIHYESKKWFKFIFKNEDGKNKKGFLEWRKIFLNGNIEKKSFDCDDFQCSLKAEKNKEFCFVVRLLDGTLTYGTDENWNDWKNLKIDENLNVDFNLSSAHGSIIHECFLFAIDKEFDKFAFLDAAKKKSFLILNGCEPWTKLNLAELKNLEKNESFKIFLIGNHGKWKHFYDPQKGKFLFQNFNLLKARQIPIDKKVLKEINEKYRRKGYGSRFIVEAIKENETNEILTDKINLAENINKFVLEYDFANEEFRLKEIKIKDEREAEKLSIGENELIVFDERDEINLEPNDDIEDDIENLTNSKKKSAKVRLLKTKNEIICVQNENAQTIGVFKSPNLCLADAIDEHLKKQIKSPMELTNKTVYAKKLDGEKEIIYPCASFIEKENEIIRIFYDQKALEKEIADIDENNFQIRVLPVDFALDRFVFLRCFESLFLLFNLLYDAKTKKFLKFFDAAILKDEFILVKVKDDVLISTKEGPVTTLENYDLKNAIEEILF